MEGFRGTICSVKEFDYLVQKINGQVNGETTEAVEAHLAVMYGLADWVIAKTS